jgi:hypothetical protein
MAYELNMVVHTAASISDPSIEPHIKRRYHQKNLPGSMSHFCGHHVAAGTIQKCRESLLPTIVMLGTCFSAWYDLLAE